MNEAVFTTIIGTGFTVAFFHAAIPTHWLPFVLTARVQKWSRSKTLAVTAIAGTGHVVFTALLGLSFALFGFAIHARAAQWFPRIAGGALIVFGLLYLYRQATGGGHGHRRAPGEDPEVHEAHIRSGGERGNDQPPPRPVSDRVALTSLFALLTFSPCESFVPFYIYGLRYGWVGFLLLTAVLSVATLAGMLVFTWLTLRGIKAVPLQRLEQYELAVMGVLLATIGILIIGFERP